MLSTPDYHISQQMKSPVQFFTLDLPVGRIIAKGYSIMKIGSLSQVSYNTQDAIQHGKAS